MSAFTKKSAIKAAFLEQAQQRRAKKFTRVSAAAIDRAARAGDEAVLRTIQSIVDTHPSVGVTIDV